LTVGTVSSICWRPGYCVRVPPIETDAGPNFVWYASADAIVASAVYGLKVFCRWSAVLVTKFRFAWTWLSFENSCW